VITSALRLSLLAVHAQIVWQKSTGLIPLSVVSRDRVPTHQVLQQSERACRSAAGLAQDDNGSIRACRILFLVRRSSRSLVDSFTLSPAGY
jgi:hypothetical protein